MDADAWRVASAGRAIAQDRALRSVATPRVPAAGAGAGVDLAVGPGGLECRFSGVLGRGGCVFRARAAPAREPRRSRGGSGARIGAGRVWRECPEHGLRVGTRVRTRGRGARAAKASRVGRHRPGARHRLPHHVGRLPRAALARARPCEPAGRPRSRARRVLAAGARDRRAAVRAGRAHVRRFVLSLLPVLVSGTRGGREARDRGSARHSRASGPRGCARMVGDAPRPAGARDVDPWPGEWLAHGCLGVRSAASASAPISGSRSMPAYLIPALPLLLLWLAQRLDHHIQFVCMALIVSPWLFTVSRPGNSTRRDPRRGRWRSRAGLCCWTFAGRSSPSTLTSRQERERILERAFAQVRVRTGETVVVAWEWLPEVRVRLGGTTEGRVRYVYDLTLAELEAVQRRDVHVAYLPGADWATEQTQGFDLASRGAVRLR